MTEQWSQALEVVDRACAAFQGNRRDHLTLQQAIHTLRLRCMEQSRMDKVSVTSEATKDEAERV